MTTINSQSDILDLMKVEIKKVLQRNILSNIIEEYHEALYEYVMKDFNHNLKDEDYAVQSLVDNALEAIGTEEKSQMLYDMLEDDCDELIRSVLSPMEGPDRCSRVS